MEALPLILCILLIAALIGVIVYLAGKSRTTEPGRDPGIPPPRREPGDKKLFHVTIQPGRNNERWQVRSEGAEPGTPLRVRRGDQISWRIAAPGQAAIDAHFQFPSGELFSQLPGCDSWTTKIGSDSPLVVQVSESVLPGVYTYAVFVYSVNADGVPEPGHAEGGSPPRIVVMYE
jgi:hypothetical protein